MKESWRTNEQTTLKNVFEEKKRNNDKVFNKNDDI